MSKDAELLRRLEDAVASMPRKQREIFLAHRLDDMSYAEIARRTGLSVKQVERQMALLERLTQVVRIATRLVRGPHR